MKTVHTGPRPCLRAGSLLLATTLLAGCGLLGGGDKGAEEGKQEEGRLARVLRMAGGLKDTVQAARQDAGDEQAQAERAQRIASGMRDILAPTPRDGDTAEQDDQIQALLGAALTQGGDLDEILQRMKDTGDLSQAGEMMSRMMQMASAMEEDQATAPESQSAAAGAEQAAASEQVRELGGIPVTGSKLTREQELALFAPQAWEDLP